MLFRSAGVVNFITKKNFEGLELGADYRHIDGSNGDYGVNVTWGKLWDNGNVLASVGWQHRSKLSVADRDWANRPYLSNPEAGWSAAGNPSTFIPLASTTSGMRDPACAGTGDADWPRTLPVDGRFTPVQRDLYELVLAAQEAGIAAVAPGAPFLAAHNAAMSVLAHGLADLGLLPEIGRAHV